MSIHIKYINTQEDMKTWHEAMREIMKNYHDGKSHPDLVLEYMKEFNKCGSPCIYNPKTKTILFK